MRISSLLVLFLVFLSTLQAQNMGSITGTVKDKLTQEPLIGVSIKLEGTEIGAATDLDGNFSLSVPDEKAILVIS